MKPGQMRKLNPAVGQFIATWEQEPTRRFNLTRPGDFVALLQHLNASGWDLGPDLAVRAGLAVVARVGRHRWPPPPELIASLLDAYRPCDGPDGRADAMRLSRVAEFAIAFLVGWSRCPGPPRCTSASHSGRFPLEPTSHSWLGEVAGAHEILRRFVAERVDYCLQQLAQGNHKGGVPGFPTQDYQPWTREVLHTFLAHRHHCDCWRNISPDADPAALTGHVRVKAASCRGKHNLNDWQPERQTDRTQQVETLWYFVERAVKGFVGPFKHEGFPAGMLHSALWRRGFRLTRANIARRECRLCGWTVRMGCEHGRYRPGEEALRSQNWLILKSAKGEPEGGFVPGRFIVCAAGHLYPELLPRCPVAGCNQEPRRTARSQTCYFMT